jgi:hypothetical protein
MCTHTLDLELGIIQRRWTKRRTFQSMFKILSHALEPLSLKHHCRKTMSAEIDTIEGNKVHLQPIIKTGNDRNEICFRDVNFFFGNSNARWLYG